MILPKGISSCDMTRNQTSSWLIHETVKPANVKAEKEQPAASFGKKGEQNHPELSPCAAEPQSTSQLSGKARPAGTHSSPSPLGGKPLVVFVLGLGQGSSGQANRAASSPEPPRWHEVCLAQESALGQHFPFCSCSGPEGRSG